MQQLTGKIPELYQTAYDQYAQEGQDLYNQYNLLGNRDAADYDRFASERNYQYTLDQNAQKLAQGQVDYLLSLGVKPNEELLKAAGYDSQYVGEMLSRAQQPRGGSGYGGSGGSGVGKDTGGENAEDTKKTASVVETAKKALHAGYTASEVYNALKKNGISSGRAHTAVKQAQILDDYWNM